MAIGITPNTARGLNWGGGEISNSITSVLKDNMLYEEYTDQGEHEERIPRML